MLLNEYNKNESKEHYELKQIAKYILYNKGYNCIATEVHFGKYNNYLKNYKWFKINASKKIIIDVIGFKSGKGIESKVLGIESKASYIDFLNGFCCQCEYTYIIAPINIIPVDKIPDKIGFIEVDLENYKIELKKGKFEFSGIYTRKNCSSRKKELYGENVERFKMQMNLILKKIANRSTINDIFKNNEIEVKGLNRKGE